MELDLFNETGGTRGMVMPAPEYYQSQLRLARDRGLRGAIARCDDGFASNVGTPAEFNVYAYSRLLHDPEADVEEMWNEFYRRFYGAEAAPVAIECLKECFEMVCALRYTLGFWTGDHAASVDYTDGHLIRHSTALWSDEARHRVTERLLLDSGPETLEAVVCEKEEAGRTAQRCIRELDRNTDKFEPEKFRQIRGYFEEAVTQSELNQRWVRTYFALRWFRRTVSRKARTELDAAIHDCRKYVEQAERNGASAERLPRFLEEIHAEVKRIDNNHESAVT
jgi:hypothetical protein